MCRRYHYGRAAQRGTLAATIVPKWGTTRPFAAQHPLRQPQQVLVAATIFLGTVGDGAVWTQHVLVNQVHLTMKIDTGGDATAIPESVYEQDLMSSPTLAPSDHILSGPDGKALSTL